jgi:hypothetical protein
LESEQFNENYDESYTETLESEQVNENYEPEISEQNDIPYEQNESPYEQIEQETVEETPYNPDIIEWAIALYSYEAQVETEISFQEGDSIGILEWDTGSEGWSRGECEGRQGLFPTSYVQTNTQYQEGEDEYINYQDGTENEETIKKREEAQKRKEKRMQLREEMKTLKDELTLKTTKREQLEKEIADLSEKRKQEKKVHF